MTRTGQKPLKYEFYGLAITTADKIFHNIDLLKLSFIPYTSFFLFPRFSLRLSSHQTAWGHGEKNKTRMSIDTIKLLPLKNV